MNLDDLELRVHSVEGLPILRRFFDRMDLERLLLTYVPGKKLGRDPKLPHGRALLAMVANVLLSREPLYAVPEWLKSHAGEFLGLRPEDGELFNDDRIGRALDRLYEMDPASLLTSLVTRVVKEFDLDLGQIHNDSTTVTFSGGYEGQADPAQKDKPPLITFGHNKDHRPDLKQLVYSLTISADGAVPVHYKLYDGNTTDDRTHIETWDTVCEIAGTPTFLYVADSKLCARRNLDHIHDRGGRFLTVLPRSRKEDDDFRELVQASAVPWQEVRRRKGRTQDDPDEVYDAHEPADRTQEGYRIIWYRSSVKMEHDAKHRGRRIDRAKERLQRLEERTGAHRFRSVEAARKAADNVLSEVGAGRWLRVTVRSEDMSEYKQVGLGRPGKETVYRKNEGTVILFEIEEIGEAILADSRCDGLFAMTTNDESMTPAELLEAYKYQPFLEKRNEQLKSVLAVAPVFLKRPERVAALLFVYYLAVMTFALIEREIRRAMKAKGIESLPLYPEGRPARSPTADLILRNFEGIRRSELVGNDGSALKTFHDPLSDVAVETLRLLGVPTRAYGV
jgi:transposase